MQAVVTKVYCVRLCPTNHVISLMMKPTVKNIIFIGPQGSDATNFIVSKRAHLYGLCSHNKKKAYNSIHQDIVSIYKIYERYCTHKNICLTMLRDQFVGNNLWRHLYTLTISVTTIATRKVKSILNTFTRVLPIAIMIPVKFGARSM